MSHAQHEGLGTRGIAQASTDPDRPDLTMQLSNPPELIGLIDGLSAKLRSTPYATVIQALVFLNVAVEQADAGKRLAIVDDDLNVEREFLVPGYRDDDA